MNTNNIKNWKIIEIIYIFVLLSEIEIERFGHWTPTRQDKRHIYFGNFVIEFNYYKICLKISLLLKFIQEFQLDWKEKKKSKPNSVSSYASLIIEVRYVFSILCVPENSSLCYSSYFIVKNDFITPSTFENYDLQKWLAITSIRSFIPSSYQISHTWSLVALFPKL